MNGGQFSEVDFDLLADYVGGALDGTPEETELARLIDEDPAWADAYAALAAGVDAVRLDLAGWAAEPDPMPSPVADRLSAVITRACLPGAPGPVPTSVSDDAPARHPDTPTEPDAAPPALTAEPATAPAGAAEVPDGPAGPGEAAAEPTDNPGGDGPGSSRVPEQSGTPHSARRARRVPVPAAGSGPQRSAGPGRRRQWARRMAGPILVATVVAGFAGFAVSRIDLGGTTDEGTTSNAASDAAEHAPNLGSGPPRTVLEPSTERVLSTGTDYTPGSLPNTISELAKQATPSQRAAGPDQATGTGTPQIMAGGSPTPAGTPAPTRSPASEKSPVKDRPAETMPELERLADPSVLADCLDAVAAAHAQGPLAVELVDYASFRGRAALVVVFTDQAGARWAWVTGPNCGTPAHGADVTYQTRVG